MHSCVVSRWRYTALMQQYWADASALTVEMDVGEVASERQALADLVGGR